MLAKISLAFFELPFGRVVAVSDTPVAAFGPFGVALSAESTVPGLAALSMGDGRFGGSSDEHEMTAAIVNTMPSRPAL